MRAVYPAVVIAILALFTAALPLVLAADERPETQAKKTDKPDFDKTSYTLGYVVSHRFVEQDVKIDEESFIRGFRAAYGEGEPAMSQEQMSQALDELMEQQRAAQEALADDDKAPLSKRAQEAERRRQAAREYGAGQSGGMYLRIDGQVPPQRINTAVEPTRRATFEADNPDANQ